MRALFASLLPAVGLSLLIAGCGGSDSGGTAATPGPSTGGAGGAAGSAAAGAGGSAVAGAGGAAAGSSAGGTTAAGGAAAGAGGADPGGAGGSDVGGAGGADPGGAGGSDMGGSAAFVPAAHSPFPKATKTSKSVVLQNVQLVTITFAGYPYKDQVEAFGDFVVGSNWMKTWTPEWGVGTGAHVAKVVIPDAPAAAINDADIPKWIVAKIADGTLPAPPDPANNDYLYQIYYPKGVKISGPFLGTSCNDYAGYHSNTDEISQTTRVAYAVNMTGCPGAPEPSSVIFTASHELNEAVLDPFPLSNTLHGWGFMNQFNPWGLFGGETADVCEDLGVSEGGFSLTRVWSNVNAAAGDDPCVPKPQGDIMYDVSAMPTTTQYVAAGQAVTYTLTGWSESPIAPWKLQAFPYNGTVNVKSTLSASTINNGDQVTLTVTVPATAKSGDYATVLVYSRRSQTDYHFWPVAITVK
jgi:hypothetical protein